MAIPLPTHHNSLPDTIPGKNLPAVPILCTASGSGGINLALTYQLYMIAAGRGRRLQWRSTMASDTHLASGGSTTLKAVSPAEAATLEAPATRKVLTPARAHGITDMRPVGLGRITNRSYVVTGEQSDWVILPAELDPLYQQGQLAAPPKARARIRELLDAGVWFDALAIAHQVPAGHWLTCKIGRSFSSFSNRRCPRA